MRQWWRPVYGAWLLTVLPVYAAAAATLVRWPAQTFLCLWWLRPLHDRVPLFVLSRCLFGAPPSWRQTLRALPGLWGFQLAGALTWRRLDPWRSFHQPQRQLERQRGRQRFSRSRQLSRGCRRQALGSTLACLLLEIGVIIGLLGLVGLMLPRAQPVMHALIGPPGDFPLWSRLLWLLFFFLAFSAVEPFYVGSGFALYLGQRARVDGWDVEIGLRLLGARLEPVARRRPAETAAPGVLLAVCAALAIAGNALAAGALPAPPLGRQARAAVDEVLRAPEFATEEQEIEWQPRSPEAEAMANTTFSVPGLPPLPRRVRRALPAIAAAGVLAYALVRWRRVWLPLAGRRGDGRAGPSAVAATPATVGGHDVRPASLPADVPAAAWTLWEAGKPAAALSLLYRGSLARLMSRTTLRFAPSWTEGDCLRAVRRHAAAGDGDAARDGELFARLTAAWQATAYGGRELDGTAMRDLCTGWRLSFGDPAADAADAADAAPAIAAASSTASGGRGSW